MEQTSTPKFSSKRSFSKDPNQGFSHSEIEQWNHCSQILDKKLKAPSETSLRIIRAYSFKTSQLLEA
jgi:hypothetical protein